VIFVVEEDAAVPVAMGASAEGVVAGGVVAGAAGWGALCIFFGRALGASVEVEPDHRVAGVDYFLRDVEGVEGVGVGRVAELPEDGRDLVVGGGGRGDEGDGVGGGVEEFEGRWWGCGAWGCGRVDGDGGGGVDGGGIAAEDEGHDERGGEAHDECRGRTWGYVPRWYRARLRRLKGAQP
jgi:hypothetical protein